MTQWQLRRVVLDKSVSDEKFLKILLRYGDDRDAEDRKLKKGIASEFKKRKTELSRLRQLINTVRPAVRALVTQRAFGSHSGTKRNRK